MAGSYARFKYLFPVVFRDTTAVIDHGQGPVAAPVKRRGYVNIAGSGVAGISEQLQQDGFDASNAGGCPPGTLHTRKTGKTPAKISVRSFHKRHSARISGPP